MKVEGKCRSDLQPRDIRKKFKCLPKLPVQLSLFLSAARSVLIILQICNACKSVLFFNLNQ